MNAVSQKKTVREIPVQYLKQARALLKMTPEKRDIKKKCFAEEIYRGSLVSPFSPTFAAQELRKCLLRHNWDGAARLLIMMLDESSAYMRKILINSCLLTVMYHPNSTQQLREEFIRKCSGVSDANELFKSLKRFPNKKLMKKRRRRTNMKESDI